MTHLSRTIELLRRGWTTALESAQQGGVLSLSQRVGDLKAQGYKFSEVWVKTPGGSRVLAYRITKLPPKA